MEMIDHRVPFHRSDLPGSLWARVAHDIRQPTQALLLLSHLIARTENADERGKIANQMEDQLVALQTMLDHAGLLASFDAGAGSANMLPCDLTPLITRVAGQQADVIRARGASLKINIRPATLTIDAKLLEIAVTGLMLNALEYSTGDQILLSSRSRHGENRIEIEFTGPKMSPRQLAAIFIELRRPRDGMMTSMLVTGLGFLSRLAIHVGGDLQCQSLPNGAQRLALVLRKNSARQS